MIAYVKFNGFLTVAGVFLNELKVSDVTGTLSNKMYAFNVPLLHHC